MKKIKYILLIFSFLLLVGCEKSETILDIETQISKLERIKIQDNLNVNNELSAFEVYSIGSNINYPITINTTENEGNEIPSTSTLEDEDNYNNEYDTIVDINLSNEISLDLSYYKDKGEAPTKIELTDLKVINAPKKGNIKFYAIIEGDNFNYLSLMKNNEIKSNVEYTKDMFGNKLIDGNMNLMFSVSIEDILNINFNDYIDKEIKDIISNNNITSEDLEFTITFNIMIYTKNDIYVIPFEYSFDSKRIFESENVYLYNLITPINFNKLINK